MKPLQLIALMLLVVMFVSGCHKDTASPEYVGNWIWQQSSGGIAGRTYKAQPGGQVILRLDEAGKLTITRSDTIFFASDYAVLKPSQGDDNVLFISNMKIYQGSAKTFVPTLYGNQGMIFQTGKLTLYDIEVSDGYSHSFIR